MQQSKLVPPQFSNLKGWNDPSQPQWSKLASEISGEKPPTNRYVKLLLSQDHLILLMHGGGVVYTFQLKDFSWTKHNVSRQSTRSMSSNSCIARPGLIVDLNLKSGSSTLELLTFDAEKGSFPPSSIYSKFNANKLLSNIKKYDEL